MSRSVHRKSFRSKYNRSPQEFHAQYAFPPDAKCQACQNKPSIRGIVMMPLDEAEKRGVIPPGAGRAPLLFPDLAPALVPIHSGNGKPDFYLRISLVYSCRLCQKDFEKALAKAPSFCIVEINRGPDPTNRVTVGRG